MKQTRYLIGLLAAGVFSVNVAFSQLPYAIFGDVPSTAPYYNEVNLLRERMITTGCQADPAMYCPEMSANGQIPYLLTRGQTAVLIVRSIYSGRPGGNGDPENFTYTTAPYFTDVPSTHGQFKYIQKLKDLGITSGCTATTFCPDRAVSFGELTGVYRTRKTAENERIWHFDYTRGLFRVCTPRRAGTHKMSDFENGDVFRPERLHGWKQIAAYMKMSERNAQRYLRYGLPVHRLSKGASVYAEVPEIEEWLRQQNTPPPQAAPQYSEPVEIMQAEPVRTGLLRRILNIRVGLVMRYWRRSLWQH